MPNQVGTRAAGQSAIPPGTRREPNAPAIRRKPAPAAARTAREGRLITASSVAQQPPSRGLTGTSVSWSGVEQLGPPATALGESEWVSDTLFPFAVVGMLQGLAPQVSFKSSPMTTEDELTIGEAARLAGVPASTLRYWETAQLLKA